MSEPIRILNLFTIMNRGGAETMVMNYYRRIDRTKVQFDFMVHRQERGAFDDEIEAMGGKIYRMCPVHPQNIPVYKKMIAAFFDKHPEYTIIHSHMSEMGYYVLKEAHKREVPFRICHAHNCINNVAWHIKVKPKWFIRMSYIKRIKRHVTHMFTCGLGAGRSFYGEENTDKFIMLNNAVDAGVYTYQKEEAKKAKEALGLADKFIIGHVGRFAASKNHQFLIEIFNEIQKVKDNAVLLLTGIGVLQDEIKKQVASMGLNDRVHFLGLRDDIPSLLKAFDVFLFPSRWEGLPVTMVEAQAAGLKCIISEKVPAECVLIDDLVDVVSLEQPPAFWAKKVLESANANGRRDTYNEIVQAGFDIDENTKWLQEFYLDCAKGTK